MIRPERRFRVEKRSRASYGVDHRRHAARLQFRRGDVCETRAYAAATRQTLSRAMLSTVICSEPVAVIDRFLLKIDLIDIGTARSDSLKNHDCKAPIAAIIDGS